MVDNAKKGKRRESGNEAKMNSNTKKNKETNLKNMIFSDMLNTQTNTNTKNPKMLKTKLRQNYLPANTVWSALDFKDAFNSPSQVTAQLKHTHCVNTIDFGSSDVC